MIVLYVRIRHINTRFVVSFLLFYTKIWFHLFCVASRDVCPGTFFALSRLFDFKNRKKSLVRKISPRTKDFFSFFTVSSGADTSAGH